MSMNAIQAAKLRNSAASLLHQLVPQFIGKTELDLARAIKDALPSLGDIFPSGWYAPPPHGIAVLSARAPSFERLNFDSLRRQNHWPASNQIENDSVVTVYVSPVLKDSLLIGDWGATIYFGNEQNISNHILKCEQIMKELAHSIQPDISFSELHRRAQIRFKKEGLNNAATISDSDPHRTNLGHTVPFSFDYEYPPGFDSESEDYRIRISTARRFINATEMLRVPENGLFTFEARLVDAKSDLLPNTLVHLMIFMNDGLVELV